MLVSQAIGAGNSERANQLARQAISWGVVLATAPDGEGFVVAELDFAAQDRVRESLPSLANRQPDAYVWSRD